MIDLLILNCIGFPGTQRVADYHIAGKGKKTTDIDVFDQAHGITLHSSVKCSNTSAVSLPNDTIVDVDCDIARGLLGNVFVKWWNLDLDQCHTNTPEK